MGSDNYFEGTQALSGNKLNLGAWYGFHEVIHKKPVTLQQLEITFKLEEDAYFYFIFNKTDQEFEAIRFSANKDFPSAFVRVNSDGKFLSYSEYSDLLISANSLVSSTMTYSENFGLELEVNQTKESKKYEVNTAPIADSYFGFRGSLSNAYIDKFSLQTVTENGVESVSDNFVNTSDLKFSNYLSVFVLFVFVTIAAVLIFKLMKLEKIFLAIITKM